MSTSCSSRRKKCRRRLWPPSRNCKKKEVIGDAGGGMVKVTMNGASELVGIKLDKQVVDPNDVEMLEDLIVAAFNNASEKVKELSNSTFGNITGGMNIPGLQ